MAIYFIDTEYKFSHGHPPRGRGSWAFSVERNPDSTDPAILWSPSMTFTEAKQWARQQTKARGMKCDALWVLP